MRRTLFLAVFLITILSACNLTPPATQEVSLPALSSTDTLAEALVDTSTDTLIPTSTDRPTEAFTPTSSLGIGSSQVSAADGMLLFYVPAGPFPMGSESGYSDERPVHTVDLPAFWVDQTEVTNGKYALCVDAGVCARPRRKSSNLIDYYYGFEGYVDYPVIFISWQDAYDYCTWAGRRLPTEAEWEKAARGIDARDYPWGSSPPDATLANFNHLLNDTSQTGSYPAGASPYEALDMAGNVLEWTADWYGEEYYATSPEIDPPGSDTGQYRAVRGGAWTGNAAGVRSAHRFLHDPASPAFDIGFRCVLDAQP